VPETQIPQKLISRIDRLEASAKVLLEEASETKKELAHFYGLAPRKGKGLSAKRKAELSQMIQKNFAHK
jgi:hypothetical protein